MSYRELKSELVDYKCLYTAGHQTTDLYLSYCGIESCLENHSYGPAARSEFLIHFIIRGKGYLQIDGKEYALTANQAFLIPPQVQTIYYADAIDPYVYAWVGFDGTKVPDYLTQTDLSTKHPVCDLNVPAVEFVTLIDDILQVKELTLPNELKRVGYLYRILSLLIYSSHTGTPRKTTLNYSSDTYVEYAIQYIEHHYNRITVNDISEYVGINRSYLHSIFKKKLNMCPQEYLISYRLKIVETLLLKTNLSITDIALQTGYNDSSSLSKAFKKQYGCPPSSLRSSGRWGRNTTDEQTNNL